MGFSEQKIFAKRDFSTQYSIFTLQSFTLGFSSKLNLRKNMPSDFLCSFEGGGE